MNLAVARVPRAMNAATSQPVIAFWSRGKRSDERGWTFGGVSLPLKDLAAARSFTALREKGVPSHLCDAARTAGYMPSELSDYLEDQGY